MFKEFKAFALRGNVMELAIAVIIGGAFGQIVASLVGDILMPLIGVAMGGVSFVDLQVTIGDAVIGYGLFIQSVIDFIIIALVIFILIRTINNAKKKEEAAPSAPPVPTNEEVLLGEIRDLLRNRP